MATSSNSSVSLTEDLLIEILTRLPLKSLVRLQCVSKAWHHLIYDACTRARHPSILSAVFYRSAKADADSPRHGSTSGGAFGGSDLGFFPFHSTSTLVDSCNGLLLFYSHVPTTLYICNPSTNRWVALPRPRKRTQLSVLAFDPYRSPHYKVLCFTGWKPRGCELELFSSESGEWADREVDWGVDTDSMSATMAYTDGSLHIMGYPQEMVSIDLMDFHCRRVELPEPARHRGRFGKSGGRLHYANDDGEEMRVWVMEAGCRWVLKHRVRVDEMMVGGAAHFNLLAFHPDVELVYVWVEGKIMSYDLMERRLDVVCELRGEMEGAYMIQAWVVPHSRFMEECLTDLK